MSNEYSHLIGLTEKDATKILDKADVADIQVIEGNEVTADYVFGRIRLWMKDGKVKRVTTG